jgi:hypothetical protein
VRGTPLKFVSPVHIFPIVTITNYLADWALLAAGSISQDATGTRDALINNVHRFTFGTVYGPNPSTCLLTDSDIQVVGMASAANGAVFAFHALR